MLLFRHYYRFVWFGAAAALLLAADFAQAQYRAYGSGIGYGPYPFYGYNGFYSNGFSQYGPPVPTFGPVPGVFGGSDQQFHGAPPSQRYYPSAEYPSPVRKLPPALLNEPLVEGRNDPAQNPTSAAIEVRLPTDDADIFFDGDKTSQTGQVRTFTSPGLEPGKVYTYEVRARWFRNRDVVNMTQKISVTAGQRVTVDFNAMLPAPQRAQ